MENPYASPPPAHDWGDKQASGPIEPGRRRGLIGHVRVLGVLMIVQGVLSFLMGLLWAGTGVFMAYVFLSEPQFPVNPNGPSRELLAAIVGGIYGGSGTASVIVGIMNCYAGWLTFSFKSRTFGIISICAGMLTLLTWMCAPTWIALLIYGLIVYLDASVKEAFEMGKLGHTPDQIDAAFNPYARPPG